MVTKKHRANLNIAKQTKKKYVPFTLNYKPTSLFLSGLKPRVKREQKEGGRRIGVTQVPLHLDGDSMPVQTVYLAIKTPQTVKLMPSTIAFEPILKNTVDEWALLNNKKSDDMIITDI